MSVDKSYNTCSIQEGIYCSKRRFKNGRKLPTFEPLGLNSHIHGGGNWISDAIFAYRMMLLVFELQHVQAFERISRNEKNNIVLKYIQCSFFKHKCIANKNYGNISLQLVSTWLHSLPGC